MKKFLKLLFILILLGAASYLILTKSAFFGSDKDFSYTDTEKIDRIIINNEEIKSIIEKKENLWFVNEEHAANKEKIEDLLLVISKIGAEYPLPKIYADKITDSLFINQGTNIQLFSGKSQKRNYFVLALDSLGCIGLIDEREQIYKLHMPGFSSNPCNFIDANPSSWLDNVIFSYYPSEITSVEVQNLQQPEQSFKIEQFEKNVFKLIDAYHLTEIENPDITIIKRYLSYFNSITFDSYLQASPADKQEILLSDYAYLLTIESNEGINRYKVIYIPENEEFDAYGNPLVYNRQHFYLSKNNGQDIMVVPWLSFDILLKNLSDFVNN